MKIKEIMTKEVKTLSPSMSVKEAIALLVKSEISGLPVVDERRYVVGMFTEKDLLRLVLPDYTEQGGEFVYLLETDGFEKKAAEFENIKVSDVMRKEVICVEEETPMVEVARLMIVKKIRRIPVLKYDRLSGIVARADIVKEIAKKSGINI